VPTQTLPFWSTAIAPMPCDRSSGQIDWNVVPASVLFQTPPEAAAA
jgi:hypothetical protein